MTTTGKGRWSLSATLWAVLGVIAFTLFGLRGVVRGGWQTAPSREALDTISALWRDTHEASVPIQDLGIPAGEACGPPWVRTGKLSVWSSLLPRYRQRFGWDVRWGLLAQHDAGWSGSAVFSYNERERRLYQEYELELTVLGRDEVRLTFLPYLRHSDGCRRIGVSVHLREMNAAADDAWLSAYLSAESQTYFGLRDWRPDQWQPGSVARASVGASFDLWQRSHGLLRRLIGSAYLTHAGRLLGAQYAYTRISGTLAVRGRAGLLRFDGGWISPHGPSQNRLDLAREGQFRSLSPGVLTASGLVALRAEGWRAVWAGLQAVSFASMARVSSDPILRVEGGVGLGVRPVFDGGTGPWKVRVDFPLVSSDPFGPSVRYAWAISVRVWIWPGLMGPLAPSDCDYAYSH